MWFKRDSPKSVESYASTVLAQEQELLDSDAQGPGLACLERLAAKIPEEVSHDSFGMCC